MSATVRVRSNRLGELAKALPGAVSATLRRGALATEAGAKVRAPFDTGNLKNTHGTEGVTPGSLDMRVTVTAEYAVPVHEGAEHAGGRKVPGRPWLRETTEQTFPAVINELKRLERQL